MLAGRRCHSCASLGRSLWEAPEGLAGASWQLCTKLGGFVKVIFGQVGRIRGIPFRPSRVAGKRNGPPPRIEGGPSHCALGVRGDFGDRLPLGGVRDFGEE
jgi:hypothetical protein